MDNNTFRDFNKMVEFYANLYMTEDIPYTVLGFPSDMDCTSMVLSVGRHSYYVGATKTKGLVYELGIKTFPDQSFDLENLKLIEYDRNSIMFHYGDNELCLDLDNPDESYLK